MKYQAIFKEDGITVDPDRVKKLEGEMAGAVIHKQSRFWPEYLEYNGELKVAEPIDHPFYNYNESTNCYVVDTKNKLKAELEATDLELTRTEEDIIDAVIGLGGDLPQQTMNKRNNKKAKRAAYLASL